MANPIRIIVVGGGVMGLSCAWRLAQGGARVTLYEKRRCGEGATLAALGALWPASPLANGEAQRIHRESLWAFEPFVREVEEASGARIAFKRLGRLELFRSEKDALRGRHEAAAACQRWADEPIHHGGPVMEFVEKDDVALTQRGLRDAHFGGLRCRVTAQVDVTSLVIALKQACLRAGVDVHENRPASALMSEDRGNKVRVIAASFDDPCADDLADAVLIAGGAWTSEIEGWGPWAKIRPVKGEGIALRMPTDEQPTLRMIVKKGPVYLIPWVEKGEILVGSTTEPDAGFDEKVTRAAREFLCREAAEIMPALRGAEVLRQWAGLRPQCVDAGHAPVMAESPHLEGLFVCAGHYKTGIGMAPYASRAMAEMILRTTVSQGRFLRMG